MVAVVIIAAMDENHAIGKENTIPWNVPEDLQRFKERTMGHAIIMGSNTWRSFKGRALPGRKSIVVSSQPEGIEIREKDKDNVVVASSLSSAIELGKLHAREHGLNQCFVIGGANIYEQCLELADVFDLTLIHTTVEEPDTFFPYDKAKAIIQSGNFALDEYHSTHGYEVISETGVKFGVGVYIKQ